MNKLIIIAVSLATVFMAGCNSNSAKKEEEHGHEHGSHENASTATLTPNQMKSIGVQLGKLKKKQLTASLKANGILRVPNQNKATATSLMGGVIKSINVQTGNSVAKGQTIATISNTTFISMQEEFLTVSSKVSYAELDFKRQQELQQGNASSVKTFQQAETELKTLKVRKAALQKQLEMVGINTQSLTTDNIQSVISITSPVAGSVSNVMVNIGSYVDANNPIAEVIDNSQLHLDLFVYEKDLSKLKEGQTIHFTLTNNPGREYDADIYAISNTFEPSTKAVAVHATVKGNKQGLIDGMSITALVSLENATVDAVPNEAVVNFEGQDYIFIVTDAHAEEEHHDHKEGEAAEHAHDEHGHSHEQAETTVEKHEHAEGEEHADEEGTTFEKIPVRKGTSDVGYTEVTLLRDIPADAQIVTKGAFFILAKMTNQGEGHAH